MKRKYVGISFEKRRSKWCAYMKLDTKKKVHLGYFSNKKDAQAVRKEALKLYGSHGAQ